MRQRKLERKKASSGERPSPTRCSICLGGSHIKLNRIQDSLSRGGFADRSSSERGGMNLLQSNVFNKGYKLKGLWLGGR